MAIKPPFYVISDTHWGHRNIIRYCQRPYDHDIIMVKRWQRSVRENDTVLHLGDLFFGGREGHAQFKSEIAPKLPGRKYIILGNHDKRKWDYEELGFTVVEPFTLKYRGWEVSFNHYPALIEPGKHIRVHGHIHNNGYARGEMVRAYNINVSVEVLGYRPHRITRLLNREILCHNQKKRYYNSRHYRYRQRDRSRRTARLPKRMR